MIYRPAASSASGKLFCWQDGIHCIQRVFILPEGFPGKPLIRCASHGNNAGCFHVFFYLNRSYACDPADIISSQIHQHHCVRAFLSSARSSLPAGSSSSPVRPPRPVPGQWKVCKASRPSSFLPESPGGARYFHAVPGKKIEHIWRRHSTVRSIL